MGGHENAVVVPVVLAVVEAEADGEVDAVTLGVVDPDTLCVELAEEDTVDDTVDATVVVIVEVCVALLVVEWLFVAVELCDAVGVVVRVVLSVPEPHFGFRGCGRSQTQ